MLLLLQLLLIRQVRGTWGPCWEPGNITWVLVLLALLTTSIISVTFIFHKRKCFFFLFVKEILFIFNKRKQYSALVQHMEVDKCGRSMVFRTESGKTLLFVKWVFHIYVGRYHWCWLAASGILCLVHRSRVLKPVVEFILQLSVLVFLYFNSGVGWWSRQCWWSKMQCLMMI